MMILSPTENLILRYALDGFIRTLQSDGAESEMLQGAIDLFNQLLRLAANENKDRS